MGWEHLTDSKEVYRNAVIKINEKMRLLEITLQKEPYRRYEYSGDDILKIDRASGRTFIRNDLLREFFKTQGEMNDLYRGRFK